MTGLTERMRSALAAVELDPTLVRFRRVTVAALLSRWLIRIKPASPGYELTEDGRVVLDKGRPAERYDTDDTGASD